MMMMFHAVSISNLLLLLSLLVVEQPLAVLSREPILDTATATALSSLEDLLPTHDEMLQKRQQYQVRQTRQLPAARGSPNVREHQERNNNNGRQQMQSQKQENNGNGDHHVITEETNVGYEQPQGPQAESQGNDGTTSTGGTTTSTTSSFAAAKQQQQPKPTRSNIFQGPIHTGASQGSTAEAPETTTLSKEPENEPNGVMYGAGAWPDPPPQQAQQQQSATSTQTRRSRRKGSSDSQHIKGILLAALSSIALIATATIFAMIVTKYRETFRYDDDDMDMEVEPVLPMRQSSSKHRRTSSGSRRGSSSRTDGGSELQGTDDSYIRNDSHHSNTSSRHSSKTRTSRTSSSSRRESSSSSSKSTPRKSSSRSNSSHNRNHHHHSNSSNNHTDMIFRERRHRHEEVDKRNLALPDMYQRGACPTIECDNDSASVTSELTMTSAFAYLTASTSMIASHGQVCRAAAAAASAAAAAATANANDANNNNNNTSSTTSSSSPNNNNNSSSTSNLNTSNNTSLNTAVPDDAELFYEQEEP